MFEFLKIKKEYVSCQWLEYGMHFTVLGIHFCDKYAHLASSPFPISPLIKNRTYNFSDFFKRKQNARKLARKGIIQPTCKGCYLLKKAKWMNEDKIKCIAISTNTSCNSNCIYCYTHINKRFYNNLSEIPVYEFLQKSIKTKKIEQNCEIQIGGGEPVLNSEFEKIMNLFIENSFDNIRIYSSGIQYSEAIQRSLENDLLKELVISIDSGNSDLYKRIKNNDNFFEVIKNVKRYCESQNRNKKQVRLKYVIIPYVNDNLDAINDFFEVVTETNIQFVLIDVEMNWFKENNEDENKIKGIFKLVKYMEKMCKNLNIEYGHFPSICYAIEKFHDMYDKTEF